MLKLAEIPTYSRNKKGWPFSSTQIENYKVSSKLDLPKITVITPSFNQGQFIEATIRSVLLQGYPNLEYFVVDGGSTDNSIEVIRKYEKWISYWISEPDKGQAHAINKGFEKATGKLVAWLNSDDIYLPGSLLQVGNLANHSDFDWIIGTTIMYDIELNEIGRFHPQINLAKNRDKNYKSNGWLDYLCTKQSGISIPQPSTFWSMRAVFEVGGLNEQLEYVMDFDLYARLANHGFQPIIIKEPLAGFRIHNDQKSADNNITFWEEELIVIRNWIENVENPQKRILLDYSELLQKLITKKKNNQRFDQFKKLIKSISPNHLIFKIRRMKQLFNK
jgi:glycosyltransferase involved in cell wall biosynthesis